jgi:nicotinamide mononucleotide adenylyltransferase
MTGYHFGHPRSPSAERESDSHSHKEDNSVHGSDSPPLTEAEVEPEREQDPSMDGPEDGAGEGEREEGDVAGKLQDLKLGDRRGSTATMMTSSRRRNSRLRDKETGYDRLNGMGDGEADLDETAPQGPGGTEEYLNGQRAYSFPKHRLRTTMKDESKIPVVIGESYHADLVEGRKGILARRGTKTVRRV